MTRIRFEEITPQNFNKCINLKVADQQENFVAPNVYSIAEAKICYPTADIFAVYAEGEMVGFVMFGLDTDDNRFYLSRLMIDKKHQGKGYGKAAALEVIERMKQIKDCREIYLSFAPQNTGAERLYLNMGFEKTGDLNGHEIVMRFDLAKSGNNEPDSANN